jgi:hypothetical protein
MTLPTALGAIVEALRSAGATEEIIAAAVKAGGEFQNAPRRQRALRKRRERAARCPPDTAERPPDAALGDVSRPPDTRPSGPASWTLASAISTRWPTLACDRGRLEAGSDVEAKASAGRGSVSQWHIRPVLIGRPGWSGNSVASSASAFAVGAESESVIPGCEDFPHQPRRPPIAQWSRQVRHPCGDHRQDIEIQIAASVGHQIRCRQYVS